MRTWPLSVHRQGRAQTGASQVPGCWRKDQPESQLPAWRTLEQGALSWNPPPSDSSSLSSTPQPAFGRLPTQVRRGCRPAAAAGLVFSKWGAWRTLRPAAEPDRRAPQGSTTQSTGGLRLLRGLVWACGWAGELSISLLWPRLKKQSFRAKMNTGCLINRFPWQFFFL